MWILAKLREIQFFSITQLNIAIAPLLEALNDKPFQKLPGCRRSAFEERDRPAMRPLPQQPYAYREWKTARASMDYHIEVEKAYYSVPYRYAGTKIDVCISDHTVECFVDHERISSHMRLTRSYVHSTQDSHMPTHHRNYRQLRRITNRAKRVGPNTARLAQAIMANLEHPEQGYRRITGIIKLLGRYDRDQLEAACGRALDLDRCSYRSVVNILKHGRTLSARSEADGSPIRHGNIRGASYYADPDANSDTNQS